jgi:hypothetical protein
MQFVLWLLEHCWCSKRVCCGAFALLCIYKWLCSTINYSIYSTLFSLRTSKYFVPLAVPMTALYWNILVTPHQVGALQIVCKLVLETTWRCSSLSCTACHPYWRPELFWVSPTNTTRKGKWSETRGVAGNSVRRKLRHKHPLSAVVNNFTTARPIAVHS